MEKRKLSLDELAVETFETTPIEDVRGTVAAHQTGPFDPVSCNCVTDEFQSCPQTCGMYSCAGGTCAATCAGSSCGCATGGQFTCDPAASCRPDDTCGGCTAYLQAC